MADGAGEGAKVRIEVRALHCPGCVARLARTLELQPGVASAIVNFLSGSATVTLRPEVEPEAARAALCAVIDDAGFVAVR